MSDAQTITGPKPVAEPAPPHADCVADPAGGLTFDVLDPAGPPEPAGDARSAGLVLRRRGGGTAADEQRLPLAPCEDGRLRAVLPSSVELPEGRWDVYLAYGDDAARRLAPGMNDLRALVDRRPDGGTGPLGVRIPYPTKHGNLSLRSWLRAPHAETGEIQLDVDGIAVRGQLFRMEPSEAWPAGAVVEARRRGDRGAVRTVPLAVEGTAFSFTLDYAGLTADWPGEDEVWDLWLRGRDPGAPEVRLARILDDVAEKKTIFSYPAHRLTTGRGPAQAGLYYTKDNELSVRVVRVG